MDWIETIKEIKQAQENNQLVIFVGSGISKNSGIPTWTELIRAIANKIDYQEKNENKKKREFTQSEMLRIPEYYFNEDKSKKHEAYYNLIRETLSSKQGPNLIDEEIFNVLPHHIITTNYDSLLEDSQNINSHLYSVVSKDSDLLSKISDRYLIKMHGELTNPETIVLKESDYIDYEQKHVLISTFVKSLLVNHSFMFLGYSLNDYNLNLIIGWINYFSKLYGIEKRPKNFLIADEPFNKFEEIRLKNKNIFISNLSELPTELEDKVENSKKLENISGKRIFLFLKCLSNPALYENYIDLSKTLKEQYKILKSYNKISFQDLINIYPFGRTKLIGSELLIFDDNEYERIEEVVKCRNKEVIDVFNRAKLSKISCVSSDMKTLELPQIQKESQFYRLYLNNQYVELLNRVESVGDVTQKIYYYTSLNYKVDTIEQFIREEESSLQSGDYIAMLLHKTRERLFILLYKSLQTYKTQELEKLYDCVPPKIKKAIKYLRKIFEGFSDDKYKMQKLLEQQQEQYAFSGNTISVSTNMRYLLEMQTYAYDYYYFTKENYIPIDRFIDPEKYLIYYIEAMLCSYFPGEINISDRYFGYCPCYEKYMLTEIDIDILIKHISTKELRGLLNKYKVSYLIIEEIDFIKKYDNLCKSYIGVSCNLIERYLFNFHEILYVLKLNKEELKKINKAFITMFQIEWEKDNENKTELLVLLEDFLDKFLINEMKDSYGILLDLILKENYLKKSEYELIIFRIAERLVPYLQQETIIKMRTYVNNISDRRQKMDMIIKMPHVLPIKKYNKFLRENQDIISSEYIFYMIRDQVIQYDEKIYDMLIKRIEKEKEKRESILLKSNCLEETIKVCLLLKLIGHPIDLDKLKIYAEYSKYLEFMIDPNEFDYSKVDFNDEMWKDLVYHTKYTHYFVEHKGDILTENVKKVFKTGIDTRNQQKIVYGILLEKEELQKFGE